MTILIIFLIYLLIYTCLINKIKFHWSLITVTLNVIFLELKSKKGYYYEFIFLLSIIIFCWFIKLYILNKGYELNLKLPTLDEMLYFTQHPYILWKNVKPHIQFIIIPLCIIILWVNSRTIEFYEFLLKIQKEQTRLRLEGDKISPQKYVVCATYIERIIIYFCMPIYPFKKIIRLCYLPIMFIIYLVKRQDNCSFAFIWVERIVRNESIMPEDYPIFTKRVLRPFQKLVGIEEMYKNIIFSYIIKYWIRILFFSLYFIKNIMKKIILYFFAAYIQMFYIHKIYFYFKLLFYIQWHTNNIFIKIWILKDYINSEISILMHQDYIILNYWLFNAINFFYKKNFQYYSYIKMQQLDFNTESFNNKYKNLLPETKFQISTSIFLIKLYKILYNFLEIFFLFLEELFDNLIIIIRKWKITFKFKYKKNIELYYTKKEKIYQLYLRYQVQIFLIWNYFSNFIDICILVLYNILYIILYGTIRLITNKKLLSIIFIFYIFYVHFGFDLQLLYESPRFMQSINWANIKINGDRLGDYYIPKFSQITWTYFQKYPNFFFISAYEEQKLTTNILAKFGLPLHNLIELLINRQEYLIGIFLNEEAVFSYQYVLRKSFMIFGFLRNDLQLDIIFWTFRDVIVAFWKNFIDILRMQFSYIYLRPEYITYDIRMNIWLYYAYMYIDIFNNEFFFWDKIIKYNLIIFITNDCTICYKIYNYCSRTIIIYFITLKILWTEHLLKIYYLLWIKLHYYFYAILPGDSVFLHISIVYKLKDVRLMLNLIDCMFKYIMFNLRLMYLKTYYLLSWYIYLYFINKVTYFIDWYLSYCRINNYHIYSWTSENFKAMDKRYQRPVKFNKIWKRFYLLFKKIFTLDFSKVQDKRYRGVISTKFIWYTREHTVAFGWHRFTLVTELFSIKQPYFWEHARKNWCWGFPENMQKYNLSILIKILRNISNNEHIVNEYTNIYIHKYILQGYRWEFIKYSIYYYTLIYIIFRGFHYIWLAPNENYNLSNSEYLWKKFKKEYDIFLKKNKKLHKVLNNNLIRELDVNDRLNEKWTSEEHAYLTNTLLNSYKEAEEIIKLNNKHLKYYKGGRRFIGLFIYICLGKSKMINRKFEELFKKFLKERKRGLKFIMKKMRRYNQEYIAKILTLRKRGQYRHGYFLKDITNNLIMKKKYLSTYLYQTNKYRIGTTFYANRWFKMDSYYDILSTFSTNFQIFVSACGAKSKIMRHLLRIDKLTEEETYKVNVTFTLEEAKLNKNFMWKIFNHFDLIEMTVFNKKAPLWFLHKDSSTMLIDYNSINEVAILLDDDLPGMTDFYIWWLVLCYIYVPMFIALIYSFRGQVKTDLITWGSYFQSGHWCEIILQNTKYIWNFVESLASKYWFVEERMNLKGHAADMTADIYLLGSTTYHTKWLYIIDSMINYKHLKYLHNYMYQNYYINYITFDRWNYYISLFVYILVIIYFKIDLVYFKELGKDKKEYKKINFKINNNLNVLSNPLLYVKLKRYLWWNYIKKKNKKK